MIDLHTHTIFSDGQLVPSELVRRAEVKGYKAIALTDHVDASNIDLIVPRLVKVAKELNRTSPVSVIPGAEITHVPSGSIKDLVTEARDLGALIVLVHGETIVEPVEKGTNIAAIEAGADILAHPGQITEEQALAARDKGTLLEITSRKGHSLSNGHVAQMAVKHGAGLILNTDSHGPSDLISAEFAERVLMSSGLDSKGVRAAVDNSEKVLRKVLGL
ncbi:MAG: histidinol phosphate phosphatase domain-containing protein [Nitrospirota bacterium]|nr:MAG: histidinol phosphate phosphatase domain-containing protein [Nitrospirota bacterium]